MGKEIPESRTFHEPLNGILTHVNEWLRFAEAKNGGLIALNMAALAGALGFGVGDGGAAKAVLLAGTALFVVSIVLLIYSFVPILKAPFGGANLDEAAFDAQAEGLNIHYFGDLRLLSASQLLDLLGKRMGMEALQPDGLSKDLAGQIVVNSAITMGKLNNFWYAAWLSMAGLLLLGGAFVIQTCNS
jgi:hypothetical protein